MTPANIVLQGVVDCLSQAYETLKGRSFGGNPAYSELYLDLAYQGEETTIQYYFIDKVNRHPFWADAVHTSDLGLSPYETKGFLSESAPPLDFGLSILFISVSRVRPHSGILDSCGLLSDSPSVR